MKASDARLAGVFVATFAIGSLGVGPVGQGWWWVSYPIAFLSALLGNTISDHERGTPG